MYEIAEEYSLVNRSGPAIRHVAFCNLPKKNRLSVRSQRSDGYGYLESGPVYDSENGESLSLLYAYPNVLPHVDNVESLYSLMLPLYVDPNTDPILEVYSPVSRKELVRYTLPVAVGHAFLLDIGAFHSLYDRRGSSVRPAIFLAWDIPLCNDRSEKSLIKRVDAMVEAATVLYQKGIKLDMEGALVALSQKVRDVLPDIGAAKPRA